LTRLAVGPKTLGVLRSRSATILLLGLVGLLPGLGCRGQGSAPSCGAVGAKLVVLVQHDLDGAKLGDETRRLVLDQVPALRDSLVLVCTESNWSEAVRACMVAAPDHEQFEACRRQLTPAQREALERSARGEPADH
jgi:hypothetical protein